MWAPGITGMPRADADLRELQNTTQMSRTRNGRMAINWLSRRAIARWRMIPLDGQWYERGRLKTSVAAAPAGTVPHSRRKLTEAELRNVMNSAPWSLAPWRRRPGNNKRA